MPSLDETRQEKTPAHKAEIKEIENRDIHLSKQNTEDWAGI